MSRNHFKCKDIFEHFKSLSVSKALPDIEVLEKTARILHCAFSSTRGLYYALGDTTATNSWTEIVALGSPWSPSPVIASSQPSKPPPKSTNSQKAADEASTKPDTAGRHIKGDRVLANSINFMRDALMSREMSYAIAEGDVGRVYEILKVCLKIIIQHFNSYFLIRFCYLLFPVRRTQNIHLISLR